MKNYCYTLLTFYLAFSCSTVSFGQNNQEDTLKLHFDKLVNLSNLQLKVFLKDEKDKLSRLSFDGVSKDGHTWQFHYPDSIYERISYMVLAEPKQNDSIEKIIGFVKIQNGDSIKAGSILFTQKTSEPTKLRYVKTKVSPNVFTYDPNTGEQSFKTRYYDKYIIEDTSDKELEAYINCVHDGYSLFNMRNEDYESQLKRYTSLTDDFPDSQSLMAKLSSTLIDYKSKEDAEKVFSHFSERQQNSYFGRQVYKYLTTTHFENILLPSSETGKLESIIEDSTKPTLVVFSASWCVWCHKLIPLLKEIYRDTQTKLNMVYISLDDPETVDKWKALLKKEEIPWRSVLAAGKTDEIRAKYTAQTIPLSLLVKPDGTFERIDVKRQDDLDKLCDMLGIAKMAADGK